MQRILFLASMMVGTGCDSSHADESSRAADKTSAASAAGATPASSLNKPGANTMEAAATKTPPKCPAFESQSISLPADDGRHADRESESWHFQTHLKTKSGTQYGVSLSFIDTSVELLGTRSATLTMGVTDHSGDAPKFTSTSFDAPAMYGANANVAGIAIMAGERAGLAEIEPDSAHILARTDDYELNLKLEDAKVPVVHGEDGAIHISSGDGVYYSHTRMEAQGTLTIGGKEQTVMGLAWSSHWYGASPTVNSTVLTIQFDNRSELMVYAHNEPGTADGLDATFVAADCAAMSFRNEEVVVLALDSWTSSGTNLSYSGRWHVGVPSMGLNLNVMPVVRASEIVPSSQSVGAHLSAECQVTGTERSTELNGECFVDQISLF